MSRQVEIDKIMLIMTRPHSRKSVLDAPPDPTFRDYAEALVYAGIRSKEGFEIEYTQDGMPEQVVGIKPIDYKDE